MRRHTIPALVATFLALPAFGAGFTPPRGCETFLTVQHKSCMVSVQWRCDETPGNQSWSAMFSSEGLESVTSYSGDYQWLDAIYMWDSSREAFVPPAADPISVSTLLADGVDTFDFTMRRTQPDRSYDIRVVGADVLTGETARIDGYDVDLVSTRVEITAEDGTVEYKAEGTQYLSRAFRQFFLGTERVFSDDGSFEDYDDTPVDVIETGEPGFGMTEPLYNCNSQDARMTPVAPKAAHKETTDDQV